MANKALEGVNVVAFILGITGPLTTSILASYGAQVLRIESRTRIEWHRQAGPFIGNVSQPDRSAAYLFVNAGVKGVTINLKHPRAMEVMTKILKWADVVVDNFAGGVMGRMGMGYEDLKKIRPDIIMLSAAIYGQSGPYADVPGHGGTLTALTGLPHITGFPDQMPQFPGFTITDFTAPRANVLAIVAALDYRQRTGKGLYIDAAQMESTIPLLTPVLLEYEANGHEAERMGNRMASAAPHGVYQCKGDNRWCTICIYDNDEWGRFCKAIGKPAWKESTEFGTLIDRLNNLDKLDSLIGEWTIEHSPEEVVSLMQKAGVAAGVVQSGQDLDNDPQLRHRHFYWELDHPEMGKFTYSGMPAMLSKTPYEIRRAPMLGEHNEYVCTELLGISDEEFSQLISDGVLE
jgi:benzylsuccinate CoA-transferase BbsF subunit